MASSSVRPEHQSDTLVVAGSNPALPTWVCKELKGVL